MACTFTTVMKKTCYISNFHCNKELAESAYWLLFTDMASLLNHQVFLIINVEFAQQAITFLNHNFFHIWILLFNLHLLHIYITCVCIKFLLIGRASLKVLFFSRGFNFIFFFPAILIANSGSISVRTYTFYTRLERTFAISDLRTTTSVRRSLRLRQKQSRWRYVTITTGICASTRESSGRVGAKTSRASRFIACAMKESSFCWWSLILVARPTALITRVC